MPLVGVPWIDTEVQRDLDRFVELRLGPVLDQLDRLLDGIGPLPVQPIAGHLHPFALRHRYPTTSMPMERAEPLIISAALSTS